MVCESAPFESPPGREPLDSVADRGTAKQGPFKPGTRPPIHPPQHALEALPDVVPLPRWNFADGILEQQAEYRRRGGRFLIPLPNLRVA